MWSSLGRKGIDPLIVSIEILSISVLLCFGEKIAFGGEKRFVFETVSGLRAVFQSKIYFGQKYGIY